MAVLCTHLLEVPLNVLLPGRARRRVLLRDQKLRQLRRGPEGSVVVAQRQRRPRLVAEIVPRPRVGGGQQLQDRPQPLGVLLRTAGGVVTENN